MAVPINTVQTFTRTNIAEDVHNIISNISPTDTPFMSNIKKGKATARLHEWLTDALAAASADNKTIEGDDAANDVINPTVRRNNYTQLSDKVVGVSDTDRAVKHHGHGDSLGYHIAKAGQELKRDIEMRLTSNKPAVPGNASTAGETAGALAFMITNADRGATGAAPTLSGSTTGYPNAGATNGTLRSVTEAMLKNAVQLAWTQGGKPSMVIMSGPLKQAFSAFAGIAAQRHSAGNKPTTIIGAADVYVSDFGDLAFVPSRFTSGRDALVIDPSLWSLDYLQTFQTDDLAKTGHSDRKMVFAEYALRCDNEAGNSVVADIQV